MKIPSDLDDDDEDDIEAEHEGRLDDEGDEFDQFKDEDVEDDFEREGGIFKQANANDEMDL